MILHYSFEYPRLIGVHLRAGILELFLRICMLASLNSVYVSVVTFGKLWHYCALSDREGIVVFVCK